MPPVEDRNDRERLKAIEIAVGQIEKQFGKGSIMRLGAKDAIAVIPSISTGSVSLDYALGIGGVPRGRVIEIFGPESSGKTTLTLQIIAEAQKLGGMAAFVDAEHALDAQYARKLGVDLDNLLVSQPDNGEQALEIVEVLVRSNGVDVVVVDSVAALVPRAEIEGEMGEAQMGLQARLMSQALRKLTGVVSKSKTCLIFINQLREKIGVMFGNPETTTGGRALKFYSSVRIDIRRIGAIKDGDVGGRRPHPREGRQEQGRPAVPRSRVRHDVRRGDLEGRRPARSGRRPQDRRQERHLVRLQRRASRAGPRERQAVPERQPGGHQSDRRPRAAGARAGEGRGAGLTERPFTTRSSPGRISPSSSRATASIGTGRSEDAGSVHAIRRSPFIRPRVCSACAKSRRARTSRPAALAEERIEHQHTGHEHQATRGTHGFCRPVAETAAPADRGRRQSPAWRQRAFWQ